MGETIFRIIRFKKYSSICDEIALLASKCNGMAEEDKLTINDFISVLKAEKISMPNSNKYLVISKISDHHLIVDLEQEPCLEIIQAEVLDMGSNDIIDGYEHSNN